MDRIELVKNLMIEGRKAAILQAGYGERRREYAPGEMLSMREAHFIQAVGLSDEPTMSEMARRLDVTQGAVTQMASRLEDKGFIFRSKASGDKRQTAVTLSEKGRQLCSAHVQYDMERYAAISNWLGEFSDEELALCMRYEMQKMAFFTKYK